MSTADDGTRAEARHPDLPADRDSSIEAIAFRLRRIARDRGETAGPLQLPEVAQSTLRERAERAPSGASPSGGLAPLVASVRLRGERFVRSGFEERVVRLGALSRGNRVLALVGYANVVVLLATLVFLEFGGQHLTNVVAFDVDATISHEVPFISVVFSLVVFVVGWSLVLTGASDCSTG